MYKFTGYQSVFPQTTGRLKDAALSPQGQCSEDIDDLVLALQVAIKEVRDFFCIVMSLRSHARRIHVEVHNYLSMAKSDWTHDMNGSDTKSPSDLLRAATQLEFALRTIQLAMVTSLGQAWHMLNLLYEMPIIMEEEGLLSLSDATRNSASPNTSLPIAEWILQVRDISDRLFVETVRAEKGVATLNACELATRHLATQFE